MRCLLIALLVLAAVVAAFITAWSWFGCWGVLGLAVGAYFLLWLLSRVLPGVSRVYFREQFRQLGGPMRDAEITVHSVTMAEDFDAVAAVLDDFDAWLREQEKQGESHGLHFDVDEFLAHNEVRLDHVRYFIDVTVSPPESDPDAKWAPHGISLRPVGAEDAWACEGHGVDEFDAESGDFRPFLTSAFEEICGERRIRLNVGLDPSHREYQFEYLHVNLLKATVEIPPPKSDEEPLRRLTTAIVDRVLRKQHVQTLSLNFLPVTDGDLEQISQLKELQYLGLSGTRISDQGLPRLGALTSLEGLSLEDTRITDAGLAHLASLTALKRLFVRRTAVTRGGVNQLRGSNPGLRVFL